MKNIRLQQHVEGISKLQGTGSMHSLDIHCSGYCMKNIIDYSNMLREYRSRRVQEAYIVVGTVRIQAVYL